MRTTIVPIFCSLVLSALCAAGVSHWWSVRQLVAASGAGWQPVPGPLSVPDKLPAPETPKPATEVAAKQTTSDPVPAPQAPQPVLADSSIQQLLEINKKTLDEFRRMRDENRDLRDQMAETNRDLMKLEFRVDTHSESFRPLPVSEDRPDTTLDVNRLDSLPSSGVLPQFEETLPLPTQ